MERIFLSRIFLTFLCFIQFDVGISFHSFESSHLPVTVPILFSSLLLNCVPINHPNEK